MSLNSVSLTGYSRFLLLAMALPLACFRGGNDEVGSSDTGTADTGSTDESCEVGTLDCACTGGNGCDPGLECTGGVCTMILADCGNGQIEAGEQCDDGNGDDTDSCTTLCMPPSCDDGIVSGDEIDVDCGIAACNIGCDFGQACLIANDCLFPVCGPDGDDGMVCQLPSSCAEWRDFTPGAVDGNIEIDVDGAAGDIPPAEVFCHMAKDDGGWTLVFTSSDDGEDTWTWNNRAKLGGEPDVVGDLDNLNLDFMSPAYHSLPVTDLLFIHQPSDVWAEYSDVGDGTMTIGEIIVAAGSPVCDYGLGGNGYPLTDGSTLTDSGLLCDTDLYFNLGDHETDIASCMDFNSASNTATFGPVWSAAQGNTMCPFDDPAEFALGPHGPCGACPANFVSTEFNHLGYGNALNLNSGAAGMGENYMQMYVR